MQWWETHRPEIFSHVRNGKIWISPVTGKQMKGCPWLRKLPNQDKYICRIYFDRPEDCKHYPVTIDQMLKDDCDMLEIHDQANPDQAQEALDKLMSDSRPAYR